MGKVYTEEEIRQLIAKKVDRRAELSNTFGAFTKNVIPELRELKNGICKRQENVYQLANAVGLSSANAITRTYSTKLGLLWERIADLAPNVISPELDLGYKIPEVDIIVLNKEDGQLYYAQLKTQKNTLTGSQSKRTTDELGAYKHHWFVACIDTKCNSTMPSSLNRLVGKDFWDKIGIDYSRDIIPNLIASINEIENLL